MGDHSGERFRFRRWLDARFSDPAGAMERSDADNYDAALYAPGPSEPVPNATAIFGFRECAVYEDAVSALGESSNLAGRIFLERELQQRRWDEQRQRQLDAYYRPTFQNGCFNKGLKLTAQDMDARNAREHAALSPRAAYGEQQPGPGGLKEPIFRGSGERPAAIAAVQPQQLGRDRFNACFEAASIDYDGDTMRRKAAIDLSSNFHDQPEAISLNNRPKKCRMSENHAKLLPPKERSMDLLFYTHMHVVPQDMEAHEARVAAAYGHRGPYLDHPDGMKNERTRRGGYGAHPDAPSRAAQLGAPGWCRDQDFDACFGKRSVVYDGATMRQQCSLDQAAFQSGRPAELPRKLPKGKSCYKEEVVMSPIRVPKPGKGAGGSGGGLSSAVLRARQTRKAQEKQLKHLRVTRGDMQQSTHRVQTPASRQASGRPESKDLAGAHLASASFQTSAMGSAGSRIVGDVNLMSMD